MCFTSKLRITWGLARTFSVSRLSFILTPVNHLFYISLMSIAFCPSRACQSHVVHLAPVNHVFYISLLTVASCTSSTLDIALSHDYPTFPAALYHKKNHLSRLIGFYHHLIRSKSLPERWSTSDLIRRPTTCSSFLLCIVGRNLTHKAGDGSVSRRNADSKFVLDRPSYTSRHESYPTLVAQAVTWLQWTHLRRDAELSKHLKYNTLFLSYRIGKLSYLWSLIHMPIQPHMM